MDKSMPPIIIIGMHRSGTSMLANMLRGLGLFIGWELDAHEEAVFFLRRNEKILNVCNGGWDNPEAVAYLIDHAEMRNKLAHRLNRDLRSLPILSYLGPRNFFKYRSVYNLDFPWGWKDPRNTILLPLWLDLFPDARIIHVYRNGIDVAESLCIREKRRVEIVIHGKDECIDRMFRQIRLLKSRGMTCYTMQQVRRILRRFLPLSIYDKYKVHSCISIEKAFDIWCIYMEKAFEFTRDRSDQVLHIKYEDFLSQPENYLAILNGFCELSNDNVSIKSIAKNVDPARKYAFTRSKALIDFHKRKKENYWLQSLGYSKV